MKYIRVIPRDLFNEAKLLKCIGRLCLLIHDNENMPFCAKLHHNGEPFDIILLEEGALTISNLKIEINGNFITFQTTYNSKRTYPLEAALGYERSPVFDDNGEFDEEFIEFLATINN